MQAESKRRLDCLAGIVRRAALLACILVGIPCMPANLQAQLLEPVASTQAADAYVPVDDWAYAALDRLHGLGFLDTAFLGLRPWNRRSIGLMLTRTRAEPGLYDNPQAYDLLLSLARAFPDDSDQPVRWNAPTLKLESAYTRIQGITGLPLRDSFHLGQTLANDFGRPYQAGVNVIDGASASASLGRLSLSTRMEFQHAPSAAGYSPALFALFSTNDGIPIADNPVQATDPAGPIVSTNAFRIVEANLSYRAFNHQISLGKSDHWLAPTRGGALIYSNNAENIYAFQIDRTEPLYVPLLSRLTGPFRYQFFVGSLKGHTDPNDPWIHVEKVNFKPTRNVEFGFSRATLWGGKGHTPITLHTFLKSFFSLQNVSVAEKLSLADPGARFGSFDFSWRLPFLAHSLTLYTDSLVHDDVSPIDAPRHAGIRPGLFLSHVPGLPRLDLRVEAVSTDPPTGASTGGTYLYQEYIQKQGYTNKGFLLGDAIGRESKGGQAWITWHLSPRELVEASYRTAKASSDFIPGGTTQNSFNLKLVKRFRREIELTANLQHEWWKAPIYQSGSQADTAATVQVTFYPKHGDLQP